MKKHINKIILSVLLLPLINSCDGFLFMPVKSKQNVTPPSPIVQQSVQSINTTATVARTTEAIAIPTTTLKPNATATTTKTTVTSISVLPTSANIKGVQTLFLNGIVLKSDGSKDSNIKWQSSDNNIALVSTSGVVTGVSDGDTIITASANEDNSKVVSIKVTVSLLGRYSPINPTPTASLFSTLKPSERMFTITIKLEGASEPLLQIDGKPFISLPATIDIIGGSHTFLVKDKADKCSFGKNVFIDNNYMYKYIKATECSSSSTSTSSGTPTTATTAPTPGGFFVSTPVPGTSTSTSSSSGTGSSSGASGQIGAGG